MVPQLGLPSEYPVQGVTLGLVFGFLSCCLAPPALPGLLLGGHPCPSTLSTLQFLALCALTQPVAYTDGDLLGLIELLCQAGLDVELRLLPKTDLQQLLLLLLQNIQEWPGKVTMPPDPHPLQPKPKP